MSLTKRILTARVLGIACGFLVRAHPATALLKLVNLVEPIGMLWVNAIRMTVVPLLNGPQLSPTPPCDELMDSS